VPAVKEMLVFRAGSGKECLGERHKTRERSFCETKV